MSANLTPVPAGGDPSLPVHAEATALQAYDPAGYAPGVEAEGGSGLAITPARVVSALKRFKWVILATTALGAVAGSFAQSVVEPVYDVNATIFTTPTAETGGNGGAVRGGNLTQIKGWTDLLKTPSITDPVVVNLALYLSPQKAADSLVFRNFSVDRSKERFFPGDYSLKVDAGRWTLADKVGAIHESGAVGDSIGRTAGFAWAPPANVLGNKSRTINFTVVTPREATKDVLGRLTVLADDHSPVIGVRLSGTAEQRPAATLNAILDQFVVVATELKKRQLNQQATTLAEQLETARKSLEAKEQQLERFRVSAITKPSETPVSAADANGTNGGAVTRDPIINNFAVQKIQYDGTRRDREDLERTAAQIRAGNALSVDALNSIGTVARDPGAAPLRAAIADYDDQQAKLDKALVVFTDSEPNVKAQRLALAASRRNILQQAATFATALRTREAAFQRQLGDASRELQEIPARTTEEGALRRELGVQSDIYSRLRSDYAGASLAQQASVPDVKVLDPAVMPSTPANSTGPRLILLATAAGLGLGAAIAVLLDLLDRRFRYPEQVTRELGLSVLGVVPRIDEGRGGQSAERAAQIVEAFRALRLNVRYAAPHGHVALGVTSPGPGDGKSLVASNLALAFAQGGWRTVLVDADVRRGHLNETFDLPASPGLVEYLEGTSLLSEVVHPTSHENLWVVPGGVRHRRAPELLATARLPQLLAALGAEHDAIIVDTPPLGAGTDAYAVGTACGQLAVVLRSGVTDVRLAKAKLKILEHLPIAIPGAILNGVTADSGMYESYSYDPEYMVEEPQEHALLDEGETAREDARVGAGRG